MKSETFFEWSGLGCRSCQRRRIRAFEKILVPNDVEKVAKELLDELVGIQVSQQDRRLDCREVFEQVVVLRKVSVIRPREVEQLLMEKVEYGLRAVGGSERSAQLVTSLRHSCRNAQSAPCASTVRSARGCAGRRRGSTQSEHGRRHHGA